jgi:hypothetical protein
MSHIRKRVGVAPVVAFVALFVALGGSSYAAITLPRDSVGTKQIRNDAVTLKKINKKARNALLGPAVLPSGRTETGVFGIRLAATSANADAPDDSISFPFPLASAPSVGSAADCTGSAAHPTAPPGKFCIYAGQRVNVGLTLVVDPTTGHFPGASRFGVVLAARAVNASDKILRGTWAVTAP